MAKQFKKVGQKKVAYAVMKLSTEINMEDGFGKKVTIKMNPGMFYIPVFAVKEDAIKHTENGKYQIIPVEMMDK
jgi:hypothetical protein